MTAPTWLSLWKPIRDLWAVKKPLQPNGLHIKEEIKQQRRGRRRQPQHEDTEEPNSAESSRTKRGSAASCSQGQFRGTSCKDVCLLFNTVEINSSRVDDRMEKTAQLMNERDAATGVRGGAQGQENPLL